MSSGGADDLANIGKLLPYTALSAVVLEAVNRGFEIDRRQDVAEFRGTRSGGWRPLPEP